MISVSTGSVANSPRMSRGSRITRSKNPRDWHVADIGRTFCLNTEGCPSAAPPAQTG
jgi:hypothetical protein